MTHGIGQPAAKMRRCVLIWSKGLSAADLIEGRPADAGQKRSTAHGDGDGSEAYRGRVAARGWHLETSHGARLVPARRRPQAAGHQPVDLLACAASARGWRGRVVRVLQL